jgi:DNA recombination protein RmuC
LDNWKNWVNEKKDEELKKSHLKKHLDSINKHIKELSGKRYARSLKKKVFPSTVMFIAFESGYLAALEHDPNIGEKAFNQNVILAGPGNIMAIIKIVETIKSKEKQIENVNEITRSASQLYDKYATLKSYLKKLVTSYNSHAKNLRSVIKTGWAGNANLEKQIINLKEKHGITAGKNIEKTLPEEDRIEDIDDPEDKGPYVN